MFGGRNGIQQSPVFGNKEGKIKHVFSLQNDFLCVFYMKNELFLYTKILFGSKKRKKNAFVHKMNFVEFLLIES